MAMATEKASPDRIRDACRRLAARSDARSDDLALVLSTALTYADVYDQLRKQGPGVLEVGKPDAQPTILGVGPINIEISIAPDGRLVTTLRVSG